MKDRLVWHELTAMTIYIPFCSFVLKQKFDGDANDISLRLISLSECGSSTST